MGSVKGRMPSEDHKNRLANVIGWVRTAKENLPAFNNGVVAADRVARASGLLDRMYRIAVALQEEAAGKTHGADSGRQAA